MTTAEVRAIFDELKEELVPLIARRRRARRPSLATSLGGRLRRRRAARALATRSSTLFGFRPTRGGSTRRRTRSRPAAASTTSGSRRFYDADDLDSLFATMHEYGHGLYEHQVEPALERTPLGSGVSLGLHESQSRMWENLVGRCLPFWRASTRGSRRRFPAQLGGVELDALLRGGQPRAPVADPHPRGRGDLQHARHPALRARAGDHRRPGRAARPARGVERDGWRSTSASRCRTTRDGRAPGRALVGRRRSATSRRTRSAT